MPLRHKTVLLESRTATTTFTVVDSARTGAHGVAAFKVTLPAETTKYKLVFAPHPNFRASHSGVVTIRIPSTTPRRRFSCAPRCPSGWSSTRRRVST